MKRIIFIIGILALMNGLYSQQDKLVSQYMFNGLLLNPAYTGSKDYMCTTFLHRMQWVGFSGAPVSDVATIHGPMSRENSALGMVMAYDKIGVTTQGDLYGTYAYRIPVGDGAKLSLGVSGGFSYYQARLSDLTYWDQNDQIYAGGNQVNFLPNVGTGAYFYSRTFYAGISVPQIIAYDPKAVFNLNTGKVPHTKRHAYFTTGYAWEMNDNVVFKPSVLLKYVDGAPVEADFNMNVLLNNMIWVGASYRTGDALVGIVELQINPKLRIGYAYDHTLTTLRKYSYGSHEIMVGYDFGFDMIKFKTPRYF